MFKWGHLHVQYSGLDYAEHDSRVVLVRRPGHHVIHGAFLSFQPGSMLDTHSGSGDNVRNGFSFAGVHRSVLVGWLIQPASALQTGILKGWGAGIANWSQQAERTRLNTSSPADTLTFKEFLQEIQHVVSHSLLVKHAVPLVLWKDCIYFLLCLFSLNKIQCLNAWLPRRCLLSIYYNSYSRQFCLQIRALIDKSRGNQGREVWCRHAVCAAHGEYSLPLFSLVGEHFSRTDTNLQTVAMTLIHCAPALLVQSSCSSPTCFQNSSKKNPLVAFSQMHSCSHKADLYRWQVDVDLKNVTSRSMTSPFLPSCLPDTECSVFTLMIQHNPTAISNLHPLQDLYTWVWVRMQRFQVWVLRFDVEVRLDVTQHVIEPLSIGNMFLSSVCLERVQASECVIRWQSEILRLPYLNSHLSRRTRFQ